MVGNSTVVVECLNNRSYMSRDGQVVAMIDDGHLKVVSFTKGEKNVRLIKDFGRIQDKEEEIEEPCGDDP